VTAEKIITALAALAHEHRLSAYRMLVEAGPSGLPAGVVAQRLDVPSSSLTFHLQHLSRAELISQRRLGRQLIYAANFRTMNALIAYLTENCCGQSGNAGCGIPVCKPDAPSMRARALSKRKSA